MPLTEVEYGDDKVLQCWRVDGMLYPVLKRPMPTDYDAHIKGIRSFEVRKDDIYVFSYPKAGAHWLHDILEMLSTGHQEPCVDPVLPILEFCDTAQLEALASPRVLQSHVLPHTVPNGVFENKLKTIILRRNPKDILVSFYKFFSSPNVLRSPFDDTIECFVKMTLNGDMIFGSPIDHMMTWESFRASHPEHPFHVVDYEELHLNPKKEVQRLAEYLHVKLNEDGVDNIIKKCSFSYTKNKKAEHPGTELYADSLYRKGVVGDFKNHLSVELSAEIDRRFQNAATNTGAGDLYKYN